MLRLAKLSKRDEGFIPTIYRRQYRNLRLLPRSYQLYRPLGVGLSWGKKIFRVSDQLIELFDYERLSTCFFDTKWNGLAVPI